MFPPLRLATGVLRPMCNAQLRPAAKFRTRRAYRSTTAACSDQPKSQRKWISFRAIFTRWVPLGSVMYVSWCYFRGTTTNVSQVEIKFYEMFPFRITSRLWGRLASCEIPPSFRNFVYGVYIRMFRVNLEEAAVTDLKEYKSLQAFFTRPLKEGVRVVAPQACVSPCDGVVLNCGPADSDRIEQVKGITYSLESFLGANNWSKSDGTYYRSLLKNKNNILHQCIIYLAPGDYHRFHSPCHWTATYRRHFSGKLLSVNPWIAQIIPGLFCMNERAVYTGEWEHGFFSMTAVGATNVGSIEIYTDKDLHTNIKGKRKNDVDEVSLVPKRFLKKGELFGQFNMGSTIVLLFEAPRDFTFNLEAGDRVTLGQALSNYNKIKHR